MTSLWLDGREPAAVPTPPTRRSFDDIVIGAGITGLSAAVMLARRGRDVAVLEARFPGAVTTGHSTAKVSLLQGTRLSTIARHHPDSLVTAYALANLEGQSWLLDFCRSANVPVEVAPAVTYAGTTDAVASVLSEYTVARRIGLDVRYSDRAALPFPSFAAVTMDDQFQVDPMAVVSALVAEFEALGGTLVNGVTVTGARATSPAVLATTAGEFRSDSVVLATGTPFLDRGLYFAKTSPHRSYAIAFDFAGELPDGMFISAESPTRSIRTAERDGRRYLLVGGNGHVVGRHPSPARQITDLERWTDAHFRGAKPTHTWSAQDYHSDDEIPFVGRLPRGRGRVWFATGYDKWGMTNGPAAAQRIVSEILGDDALRWAQVIGRRMTVPADLAEGIVANIAVAKRAVEGWIGAERSPAELPAVGTGQVGSIAGAPIAVSNVGGAVCRMSAVCPHLGGVVGWNDAESSWDCPLHGSRFSASGERLEGPATRGLTRVD